MKTDKERLEFGKKWVEALRSGKYKQRAFTMYDPVTNCYCGLGVACAIANPDLDGAALIQKYWSGNPDCAYTTWLPQEVADMLPFGYARYIQIAEMGDTGSSFEQIADYVEGLFS